MSASAAPLRVISSMATRQVLAELVSLYRQQGGTDVQVESVGGVDAAKRVQASEAFDVVALASRAIDELIAAGRVLAPRTDLVHSGVAVAVRSGAPLPDLSSEDAVKAAVLAAPTLSCSTGPSGVALAKLFERWGIAQQIASRMVQAPPGVPVGTLVARGEAAMGFQQLSELMHLPGITVAGPLPPAIQINTTFSAGVAARCSNAAAAQHFIAFLASAAASEAKRRHGMEPA